MRELLKRLRAAWDGFSSRERILVSAVVALFSVMLLSVAVVNPILGAVRGAHARAEDAERQVTAMQRLRREYDEIQARLGAVEQRVRAGRNRTGLRTLLESLAKSSAVKIDAMEERQAPDSDRYRQTKVEVSLKHVTLSQTVNYLHNIESADRVLTVKSLRIKSIRGRSDQGELLDVTFAVSSFEPL